MGTRTPARGPTPHPHHPRPSNDYDEGDGAFIVRAGAVVWMSGDPCGRPRTKKDILIIYLKVSAPPRAHSRWRRYSTGDIRPVWGLTCRADSGCLLVLEVVPAAAQIRGRRGLCCDAA